MKRIALAVLLLAIMAFGSIGTTFAQGNAVTNYTFTSEAEWLDESYMATVRGNQGVNVRSIPTTKGNDPLFSLPAGATVEVVATVVGESNEDWALVRAWTTNGYEGHGYLNLRVANLNTVATLDAPQPPACTQTDEGAPVNVVVRFNTGWTHDAMSTACAIFYEGRQEETEYHQYWVVRDNDTTGNPVTVTNTDYLHNGFFWLLEGMAWVHPTTWNTGNGYAEGYTAEDMEYAPMISRFAADKQAVMAAEGYAWDIIINTIDGTAYTFEYGAFAEPDATTDRCDFTEPRPMTITGIYIAEAEAFRSTSVGALNCTSVFFWQLPDGTNTVFLLEGTDENLLYKYAFVSVIVPSGMSNSELRDFVTAEIVPVANDELPANTEVTVEGITGMTSFTTR